MVVDDGFDESLPFVVRVTVEIPDNAPPSAQAVNDTLAVLTGTTVVLDGSPSADPEGAPLTFRWRQVDGVGEPVNLIDADVAVASFTAPNVATRLFFQLIVNDGAQDSPPFVVRVDVGRPPNQAPVARAAAEIVIAAFGDLVVLDGSTSTDGDGDVLSFTWTAVQGEGPPVNLLDATSAVASFAAPDVEARLFFQLVVGDGRAESLPFVVRVDVGSPPNAAPEAVVDADAITVFTADTVVLDASASTDDDGDPLLFSWVQIAGDGTDEPVNLVDSDQAVASFTAPNVPQRLFFRLLVSDGISDSAPLVVRVDVLERPDLPPTVVVVDADIVVNINQTVVLDASGSLDPEGRPLSFRWEQVIDGGVPVNVNGALTAVASFTAPDTATRLFFRLFVSDGTNEAPPAVVRVDVEAPPPNLFPTSLAGSDATQVQSGAVVNLTGSASFDPDGTVATFRWSLLAGPADGLAIFTPSSADIADPQVQVIGRGSYFIGLVVVDDEGGSSAIATVRIDALNNVPAANAGPDGTTVNGNQVTAIGTALDFDGDDLSFVWTLVDFPDGGRVSLIDPDRAAVKFTPSKKTAVIDPAQCGPAQCYVLQLVVSDGRSFSIADTATYTSTNRAPLADAGPDTDVISTIVLDGSGSSDPDGDIVTSFTWTQVLGPQLAGEPTFVGERVEITATEAALYQFELVVSDGLESSAPDRVVVLVGDVNEAPVISCATSRFRAPDGLQGDLSCSVTDLNNDVVATTWTRTAGSALFPATLDGATPDFFGPSYATLINSPDGNSARYEITATDGTDDAVPVQVEVFGVPGAGLLILDTGPGSSADPDCGTVAKPCSTLAAANTQIDPDNDAIGDGRDLVLTTATFSFVQARIPGGTSLFGGRDPFTFSIAGDTELLHGPGAVSSLTFLAFTSTSQDAVVENVTVRFIRGFDASFKAVECAGCTLTLRDMSIVSQGAINLAGLEVSGGATVVIERTRFETSGVRDNQEGLLVLGGTVTVTDTDFFTTRSNFGGRNGGVRLVAGTVTLERARIIVNGAITNNDTNGIRVEGGIMRAINNFVVVGVGGEASAISQAGGSGSYLFNTLVAPGGTGNTGAVELATSAALMGNILAGYSKESASSSPAPATRRCSATPSTAPASRWSAWGSPPTTTSTPCPMLRAATARRSPGPTTSSPRAR